ncbi:MAG: acyl-CoA dehydrogenase family protein, partial [Actinomycetota bacterium]
IRPLREITGDSLFNEVFLDGVFIPDDCVVGEVDGGWTLARTTLANERVALASSSAFSGLLESIVRLAGQMDSEGSSIDRRDEVGAMLVEAQSLALMRQRQTIRSLNGLAPGGEASLAKLLGAEHEQRVADLAVAVLGGESMYVDGDAAAAGRNVLHTLCLTIAGGTSEVQRNVIGERLLGLPRDPEPTTRPA